MSAHPALVPGRVAVITGAASGIGLAAALKYAELGMKVAMADANSAALAAGVATGLQFYPPDIGALNHAISRAFDLYADPESMRRLRLNGMRADVSWREPAKRYAALYAQLKGTR